METLTESAQAVIRSSHNQSQNTLLDASCKQVLAIKGVLAWILKNCVPEYANVDVGDIEHKYIEGEPLVSLVGINPDETGADVKKYLFASDEKSVDAAPITRGEIISGSNTEFIFTEEGKATFDIYFRALAPKTEELIRFYVDIEAQNDTSPGYPLTKRAFFNVCRVVSAQKGTEFSNDEYEDIKKVYTIWICPKPPERKKGTITRYFPQEECIVGQTKEKKDNYDLFEIRMIYLPDADGKKGSGILRMLDSLLSPRNSLKDKLDSLKNDFGIPITQSIERKVSTMCDYSTVVRNDAKEEQAKESAKNFYAMGVSVENIAKGVGYTVDTVKKWLDLMPAIK